ncbi:hypothetical protein ACK83U_08250 [Rhizobium sp. WW22]|uniref:hypothetical protein n=1 Tax=Rhizobium sp. WW22 TaxID=3389070 RepID=UPI00399C46B7
MGNINRDVEETFFRVHPEYRNIVFPFTYHFNINHAKLLNNYNTKLVCFLLNPDSEMRGTFGFTDEILLIYSPYTTIQPRTMQAVESAFSQAPYNLRANPLVFFLITGDLNGERWLDNYLVDHPQFRTPIVIDVDSLESNKLDRWYIRNKMSDILFSRDIYDYQLPLDKDMYFFGRNNTVNIFIDSIKKSQNRGLFGLRKTGKTSILYKLKRTIDENKIAYCVYLDCKRRNIRSCSWDELLNYICDEVCIEMGKKNIKKDDDPIERMRKLIQSSDNRNICIIFDEIEFISPLSIQNTHWSNDFIDFWQIMWSLQSEIRRLSFIVAGVNPLVTEIDLVNKIQNPMFGIVRAHMLTGLDALETRTMVTRIGKQMGMNFDESATDYLFFRYGGHPLLTRMACSYTNQGLISRGDLRPVQITDKMLKTEETRRDGELQFYCRHIVSELREFYPEEYEILEMLATGNVADFFEFATQPEWIKHVNDYGILKSDGISRPTFKIPVLQRYIASEYARLNGKIQLRKVVPANDRNIWLSRRKAGLISEFRTLLRQTIDRGQDSPYGGYHLPESHRISSIKIVNNWSEFSEFITEINICLNETIDENHGTKYFFNNLKTHFPSMFNSLNRIRVFRNNVNHLKLKGNINNVLEKFLDEDLMGNKLSSYDEPWFLLQQICLDELFVSIQVEINRFS